MLITNNVANTLIREIKSKYIHEIKNVLETDRIRENYHIMSIYF